MALFQIGRGQSKRPWEVRREAALMLQRQLVLLPGAKLDEHDFWLVKLGLKQRRGLNQLLRGGVLTEGFSTRELKTFIGQWRRRLLRPAGLGEVRPDDQSGANLEYLVQCEYRIFLSRYLFSPEEVVARILSLVRITKGEEMPHPRDAELIRAESKSAAEDLPKYERRILELLAEPERIYWVSERPETGVGELVACPRGTVVMVVKPPGSCCEFELKRVGTPTSKPLSVRFTHNGQEVPPSHRLQAGSFGWHIRFEARAAARFRRIYHLVHGISPAISITHCAKSIRTVPTAQGECSLIEYFGSSELFGEDYDDMRHTLRQCVQAGLDTSDLGVSELPGELGRTMNFLIQTWPAQSVQSNTSSLRLDRLAEYLSPNGAEIYFGVSSGGTVESGEALAFADHLLEEVLGDFIRPSRRARTYSRYLSEAFARNRKQANKIFVALLRELGAFWGTLAGVNGYSNGESFVSRNVGLRSSWQGARWHVGLRFMDQDDLHIADPQQNDLSPDRLLKGMLLDQRFATGSLEKPNPRSSLSALSQIYRVTPRLQAAGLRALKETRNRAVKRTRRELERYIPLRDFFSPTFLKISLDCERIWTAYARQRKQVGTDRGPIDRFLKDYYRKMPDKSKMRSHARALRESGEHFFLNPKA
jgi:hypothetical protein